MTTTITPEIVKAARDELWRLGEISWKLDPEQLAIYEQIRGTLGKLFVVEGARKIGKSFVHGLICLETAQKNPGKQINWAGSTADAVTKILKPILEELSADAPADVKGSFHAETGQWRLPNKAFIQIFGAVNRAACERGRGPSAILNVLDESGFIDWLEYLCDSILSPQLRRVKRSVGTFVGMTLLVSTSPYTPSHHFCTIADSAAADGAYVNKTIYDSGFETREEIEAYIASEAKKKNMGVDQFKSTSTFKREYLSQRVVDESVVVIPEAHAALPFIVGAHERPLGFDEYIYKRVSTDLGIIDKTACLFGYADFSAGVLVIESELVLEKPNTKGLASAVRAEEQRLWCNGLDWAESRRLSRVMDDPQGREVMNLQELEKLRFECATKHDRDASINLVRTLVQTHRLKIHPSCTNLIRELLGAERTKDGSDFKRDKFGHQDCLAALLYWCRDFNHRLVHNPYPSDFDALTGRALKDSHVLSVRRAELNKGKPEKGLAAALLSGNKFVSGLNRRR